MLAEIKGKVSRTGSNLSERLEDNLTGNVFGVLRYLPFSDGLGKVLANVVKTSTVKSIIEEIPDRFWADRIEFWPYDQEGELDALLTFKNVMIGVEVKFLSGLSSVDDADHDPNTSSKHQLARESQIVAKKGGNKKKVLLFIADRQMCKAVEKSVGSLDNSIIEDDVELEYVAWQDFLHELKQLNGLDHFQQIIIQDLIELLTRKGFEDFIRMDIYEAPIIHTNQLFDFNILSNEVTIDFITNPSINEELYYEFN
ncbi:hypothetical protein [Exiguobacterium sp. s146]|uniref:hypothetical protein n=1 Tax=Exiguobacterium sp. s146 TaxID=2751223 RepID=UPI001BE9B20C|nr:hypothetical protein [Exiguobacterium sp. s146]